MGKQQCVQFTIADLKNVVIPNDTRPSVAGALAQLEKAFGDIPITICSTAAKSNRGKSPYNEFVSSCMKDLSGPVTGRMKECAKRWRARKG